MAVKNIPKWAIEKEGRTRPGEAKINTLYQFSGIIHFDIFIAGKWCERGRQILFSYRNYESQ